VQKYEYKILDVPAKGWWIGGKIDHQELVDKLNELGREGWEAVSCSDINKIQGASRGIIIIMKKPIN
jgi:Domain of unknown function (DUF4177)